MDDMNNGQMNGGNPDFRTNSISSNNNGFNSANALEIRLDTSIVAQFEKYLKGVDSVWVESEGGMKEIIIYQGQPMVNKEGYQAIMQWINIVLNKATIQANFVTEDDYGNFMCDVHKDLTEDLLINRNKFDIKINNISGIVHKFTDVARLVMTRPLFDKERLGMNNTTRVHETMQSQQNSGGFIGSLLGGKR